MSGIKSSMSATVRSWPPKSPSPARSQEIKALLRPRSHDAAVHAARFPREPRTRAVSKRLKTALVAGLLAVTGAWLVPSTASAIPLEQPNCGLRPLTLNVWWAGAGDPYTYLTGMRNGPVRVEMRHVSNNAVLASWNIAYASPTPGASCSTPYRLNRVPVGCFPNPHAYFVTIETAGPRRTSARVYSVCPQ
jgi:hypothetical protein